MAATALSRVATRSRTHRVRIAVLTLVAALLAPLFVSVTPAQARPWGWQLGFRPRNHAEQTISRRVLWLINAQRRAHGLRPVHMNWDLRTSARRHNMRMMRADMMSHQLPGEPVFTRRMSQAGYNWSWAGENVGWNSQMTGGGVLVLQRMMYRERPPEDGHRQNILNGAYTNVGVDVLMDYRHHRVWLTTDFGRPLR